MGFVGSKQRRISSSGSDIVLQHMSQASPLMKVTSSNGDRSPRHHPLPAPAPSPQGILKGMVVQELCGVDDMADGEVREFEVNGKKILLVKDMDEFQAVGAQCPHNGASLANGAYCNGRIRCPWHGACFEIATGDLEDFPGLDSLPKFATKIEKDKVIFMDNAHHLKQPRRTRKMAKQDPHLSSKSSAVIIIGGGASALACAESLRQEGFTGVISMISQEAILPYDRTQLSKDLEAPLESLLLRPEEFYHEHGIGVLLNTRVVKVDLGSKITVETENGAMYHSKYLVVASGSRPKALGVPGEYLDNIFTLRSPEDSQKIAAATVGKNVVIVGSYFVGMELASCLSKRSRSVTVVGQSRLPFRNAFDQPVGKAIKEMFEERGVKFLMEHVVSEFRGSSSKLEEVVLDGGMSVPADVCIVGIGVTPNTEFMKKSGIEMNSDGFIMCSEKMETSSRHVYACGDIVFFPLTAYFDSHKANIQHWSLAMKQGQVAGRNIAGKPTSINTVPFFWTSFFGHTIRYTGYGQGYDHLIVHGKLEELQFVAYFLRDEKLVAVATMSSDPTAAQIAEAFQLGLKITEEHIHNNEKNDWSFLLKMIT